MFLTAGMTGPTQGPPTGAATAITICVALVATVFVPPCAAFWLNSRRIESTQHRLIQGIISLAPRHTGPVAVACGEGRLPDITAETLEARGVEPHLAHHDDWIGRASHSTTLGLLEADAWGRCLLVRTGGELPTFVVSAGPNGVMETQLLSSAPSGDDIGAVAR
jgi:hypothetical protein